MIGRPSSRGTSGIHFSCISGACGRNYSIVNTVALRTPGISFHNGAYATTRPLGYTQHLESNELCLWFALTDNVAAAERAERDPLVDKRVRDLLAQGQLGCRAEAADHVVVDGDRRLAVVEGKGRDLRGGR